MKTLRQIVHAACDEMGITRPSSLVGSTDPQAQQLLSLAQLEGRELASRENWQGGWPQLRTTQSITLVNGQQDYQLASDVLYFINTTLWDTTQKWPLRGPISPQEWQVLKAGTIGSTGPRMRFRLIGDASAPFGMVIRIDPVPSSSAAGNVLTIEYTHRNWVLAAATSTATDEWESDSDTPLLPDECFISGLKWRFKHAKGLDYAEDFNHHEDVVTRHLGRSGMAPVVDLANNVSGVRFVDEWNIPDTGYGA